MIKIIKTVKDVDYEMNFNDNDKERLDALIQKSPLIYRYADKKIEKEEIKQEENIFADSESEQSIEKRKYNKRSY